MDLRLRFCGRRERFDVPDDARADVLRAMAKALTDAECDPERAEHLLRDAASASATQLAALVKYVEAETVVGLPEAEPEHANGDTFQTVAESWVTGRSARRALPNDR